MAKEIKGYIKLQIPGGQAREVAEEKMPDLNAFDIAWAMKIVDGTARATGVTTDVHEMTADEIRAKLG